MVFKYTLNNRHYKVQVDDNNLLGILQPKETTNTSDFSDRELKYYCYAIAKTDTQVIAGIGNNIVIKDIRKLYEKGIKFTNATLVKQSDGIIIIRGLNCSIPYAICEEIKNGGENYEQFKKNNYTRSNTVTRRYRIDRRKTSGSIQSSWNRPIQTVQSRQFNTGRSNQEVGRTCNKGFGAQGKSKLDREVNKLYNGQTQDNRVNNSNASGSNWVGRDLKTEKEFNEFVSAFEIAKKANRFGCCVDSHSTQELQEMKAVRMYNDGNAGVAVEKNGNIVSVFKNPNCKMRGFGTFAVKEAIKCGGVKLDCYCVNSMLPNTYLEAGMVPVCRIKFNPEYKPDDWNDKAGEPDVVFMIKNNGILPQKDDYREYTLKEVPYLYDTDDKCAYDLAAEYADNKLKEIERIKKAQVNKEAAKKLKNSKGNLMKAFSRKKN